MTGIALFPHTRHALFGMLSQLGVIIKKKYAYITKKPRFEEP